MLRGEGLQAAHHMAAHAHLPPELARLPLPLLFRIHLALPFTQALAALHATLQLCQKPYHASIAPQLQKVSLGPEA